MVFRKLRVGPDRPQLPENCCRESFGNCLPASVHQPPRPANIKGEPTKRIVRTLTIESAGANRLTYGKDLLNSRKNSHLCKTNHPGFPHALPPYDRKGRVSCKNVVRGFSLVRGWHYRTLKGRTTVPLGPVKPTNSYVVAGFIPAFAVTPPHYVFGDPIYRDEAISAAVRLHVLLLRTRNDRP
jgi:hypothetical protein